MYLPSDDNTSLTDFRPESHSSSGRQTDPQVICHRKNYTATPVYTSSTEVIPDTHLDPDIFASFSASRHRNRSRIGNKHTPSTAMENGHPKMPTTTVEYGTAQEKTAGAEFPEPVMAPTEADRRIIFSRIGEAPT